MNGLSSSSAPSSSSADYAAHAAAAAARERDVVTRVPVSPGNFGLFGVLYDRVMHSHLRVDTNYVCMVLSDDLPSADATKRLIRVLAYLDGRRVDLANGTSVILNEVKNVAGAFEVCASASVTDLTAGLATFCTGVVNKVDAEIGIQNKPWRKMMRMEVAIVTLG